MTLDIFHLGISVPPNKHRNLSVQHTALIDVNYHSRTDPREISEFMRVIPTVLILSQNGVRGLKKWMDHHDLDKKYINKLTFWTVGERTHECLLNTLGVLSEFPEVMTGLGVIQALQDSGVFNVLLVSGEQLISEFVTGLTVSGLNYYHFPVYETEIIENEILRSYFENRPDQYVVFTSPSTVAGFLHNMDWYDFSQMNARCISIGPTTSRCICDKSGVIFFESDAPIVTNLYNQLDKLIFIKNHEDK